MYVNVLKHIYKQAKSFIRLHKDSDKLPSNDTKSKLFTACLEKVFRKLNCQTGGVWRQCPDNTVQEVS